MIFICPCPAKNNSNMKTYNVFFNVKGNEEFKLLFKSCNQLNENIQNRKQYDGILSYSVCEMRKYTYIYNLRNFFLFFEYFRYIWQFCLCVQQFVRLVFF